MASPLFGADHEKWKPQWGTLWSKIQWTKAKNDTILDSHGVLISLWRDNAVVRFATTIHEGTEWITQERKKPRDSSSSAAIAKAPFEVFPKPGALNPTQIGQKTKEYVHVRPLPVPKMVDDYNHFMNGVDIADQLRARFSTQLQSSRTWMPMFYYLLDTAIGNAYILSKHHRKSKEFKYVRGTHRAFREALIDELLVQYKIEPTRKYANGRHLPVCRLDRPRAIHETAKTTYCGRCHFCRFRKDMLEKRLGIIGGVGFNKNVQQTQVMCQHCQVYLCKKCFTLFHDFEGIQ